MNCSFSGLQITSLLLRKADLNRPVIGAIKDFRKLKEEEIEKIEAEINRLAREKPDKESIELCRPYIPEGAC